MIPARFDRAHGTHERRAAWRGALGTGAAILLTAAIVACGKRGPPLAPLHLVPAAVSATDARRSGDDVELRFGLPTTNLNGPGPIEMARVEIYAVTLAPGAPDPGNRELLTKSRLVGTIEVKPPPVEGTEEGAPPAPPGPPDTRPAPGDRVMFVEELTEEKLKFTPLPVPPLPELPPAVLLHPPLPGEVIPLQVEGAPAAVSAPAAAASAQAAAPPPPKVPSRLYAIRGVTRGGRPGQPVRVKVPIVDPPAPPTAVAAKFTETSIVLDWTPPAAESAAAPVSFNVYQLAEPPTAINAAPLTAPAFEQPVAEWGKEACFVVRSVQVVLTVPIESPSSPPACTTPRDIFPPAAPGGLQTVPTSEGVSLSWDVSGTPDLAGYVLLRGEAADDTLRPLTPEPIRDTTYRDTTVKPGVEYVYAVVAVDKANNRSAESERRRVTAR